MRERANPKISSEYDIRIPGRRAIAE